MITLLIGTTAIISTIGVVYVTRKAWYGFHRAVGIEPGKMSYVPVEQVPFKTRLLQVQLTEHQLRYLPTNLKIQLQHIDDKANTYRTWQSELQHKHHSLHTVNHSENQFVLSKLMNEHLPEIINTYHQIQQRKQGIHASQPLDALSPHSPHSPHSRYSPNESPNTNTININNQNDQALSMLIELLNDIENRLDILLTECEQQQLQDLQVMKRYLRARD